MGSGNTVEAGDEYGGMFTAIGRSDTEKKTNNEVRTELLKTLGNLFGLKGMNEENGKVTFTKAFMDELERIIGSKEFKRDDFDIKNGVVSSGRPLTMRRVTAILDKAEIYGAAAKKTGDVTGLPDNPKELYVGYAQKTALKAKLIGKSCQMIELEKAGNGTKFKPIVKQGKPVIKQLTAKDLDILGPACFKNLNGF